MRYSTWKCRPSRRNADSRRVRPCLESLEDRTLLSGLTTFVYTESNDSNGNAVLAFQQNANGTLTEIGSFSTGGYGFRNISPLLGPNDSSFEVVTTPDNRFLFAVNQGSSSVSAFTINNSNGGLTLVGTFNSLGVQPDSLAVSGNHLYVTNRGDSAFNPGNGTAYPSDDVPNITVFNIGGNGALTAIPGSTVTFNEQSSPSHSLITPDGKLLFVDNFATPAGATQAQGGNTLIPYQIQADGTLVPVASGPVGAPVATPLLLGAVLNPDARVIYAGLALDNEVAVFSYDASGNITYIREAPIPMGGITPCWAAVSADGKFLYTGDSNSDSVGVFSLVDPTNPVQIQEFTLNGPYNLSGTSTPLKVRAFQVALSPDGKTLYAISAANAAGTSTDPLFPGGNQVHALTVDTTTGLLTEPTGPVLLDTFGVPGDAAPQGAAVVTVDVTWAVADFTGQGVYRFLNTGGAPTGSDWTLLTMADAAEVAVAANGDVVAVFAPGGRGVNAAGVGVWRCEDSTGWVKLSAGFADGVSIVDSGAVAATFASGAANVNPDAVGVWRDEDSTNWQHLNAVGASSNPPPAIAGIHASIVGLDDAGDVVGEFPGAGVWLYTSSTNSWQQPAGAPTLDASLLQLTANGILTAEFPGHGIWEITALTATPPTWAAVEISQDVSTLGVNVNNVFAAVFDNPPPNGTGVYRFTPPVTYASLEPLNGVDAAAVAVGASDNIFANFGPAGLYYFDSVSAMISQTFPTGVSPSDPVTVFSVA